MGQIVVGRSNLLGGSLGWDRRLVLSFVENGSVEFDVDVALAFCRPASWDRSAELRDALRSIMQESAR